MSDDQWTLPERDWLAARAAAGLPPVCPVCRASSWDDGPDAGIARVDSGPLDGMYECRRCDTVFVGTDDEWRRNAYRRHARTNRG